MPILPAERDPRLITVRRGGTLTDEQHRLLGEWAALCAEHVLHLFVQGQPRDTRPRDAIDIDRAWVRDEVRMRDAHRAAFVANAAALTSDIRGLPLRPRQTTAAKCSASP
ncbi:putative immunity protein [Paenarthrobacter sp. PH39-S1]|uniref:putative immunity protein n=1 Tax=Paenarthrobacter sp. PH39-S1 TaxID=3046204 RepID=UPI0032D8ED36